MPKNGAKTARRSALIRRIFQTLEAALGPQYWWPAYSPFEVVVGAYLTQNTAWTNVERAIGNLRAAGALSLSGVREASQEELEKMVRPAGYFRQKAARLKRFVAHLDTCYGGSLEAMFARPPDELRVELLGLNGIGPETADSILLYAASGEVFVVDAYTRRIFERHALASPATGYEEIRSSVEMALSAGDQENEIDAAVQDWPKLPIHPPSAASGMPRSELSRRYNEFHALLVQIGKHYCLKAAPNCQNCPLSPMLPKPKKPR